MKTPSSSSPLIVCAALAFAAAALGLIAVFLSVPPLGIAAAAVAAADGIVLLLLGRKAAPAPESPAAAPCAAAAPTLGEEGERCCPYCGEILSDAALFCPACGAEQPWQLDKI